MSSWVRCQRSVSHHSDREGVPCLTDMKVTCPVPRGAGAHIRPAGCVLAAGSIASSTPGRGAGLALHGTCPFASLARDSLPAGAVRRLELRFFMTSL